jgi:hypothetical protein
MAYREVYPIFHLRTFTCLQSRSKKGRWPRPFLLPRSNVPSPLASRSPLYHPRSSSILTRLRASMIAASPRVSPSASVNRLLLR